jgi:hypothetical protein
LKRQLGKSDSPNMVFDFCFGGRSLIHHAM